jgi:ABC-type transport system substrate-binding protein
VTQVDTPDPLTAIIRLSKSAPYLLTALDASESPIVPKHVYEGTDPLTNKNASAPIGTGPFLFKEWVKGSHIILERNPDYWDSGKPYLDRVVVRFIADKSARSAAFETGELDIGGGPPVPQSDLARLQALPGLGSETRGYEYNGNMTQLYFNYDNPIFKDKRVREAIAHAVDVNLLLETVYFGYGKVAPAAISSNLAAFSDTSIKPYKYDPVLSAKLLDEAGFPKKADGTRLSLRLYANPYNYQASGDFVKQALTRIGIAVDFQFFDFSTYIQKTYTGREFDLTLESLSNIFDPNQAFIAAAPLLLIFLADMSRAERIARARGISPEAIDYFEMALIATIDAALAAQNAALAAESIGLGTCYVGAIRNRIEDVARELKLPPRVYPVFGLVAGHPDPAITTDVKPRLPQSTVLHREVYGTADEASGIASYDERMHRFQEKQHLPRLDWTRQVSDRIATKTGLKGRERLRHALEAFGFALK